MLRNIYLEMIYNTCIFKIVRFDFKKYYMGNSSGSITFTHGCVYRAVIIFETLALTLKKLFRENFESKMFSTVARLIYRHSYSQSEAHVFCPSSLSLHCFHEIRFVKSVYALFKGCYSNTPTGFPRVRRAGPTMCCRTCFFGVPPTGGTLGLTFSSGLNKNFKS